MCWRAERGLPICEEAAVLLTIPDIRQDQNYDCGDAAIDAALAAIGVKRKRGTRLANEVYGMTADTVAAVLRASGACVLAGPMVTGIEGLRHFTRAGCPVLCPIAERGGHWVVVRGVTGGACRGRVHYHDPVSGAESRCRGDWLAAWHDWESETGHAFERWGIVVGSLN